MSYQGNPSYPPQQPVPQGTYALPPPGYQQQAPPFSGYPNSTGAGTYASAPPVYTNGPPAGYPGGPHVGYPGGPPAEYPGGPHPGYPSYPQPGAPPTSTVVVIDQGIPLGFGRFPTNCVCPSCHMNVLTHTTNSPGVASWICCIGLCFIFPICFFIPFLIQGFYDTTHSCPSCGITIARKPALSD